MRKNLSLLLVVLVPFVMGAQDTGGCTNGPLPTVAQIELELPSNIRTCSKAPRSPGKNASKAQTAEYLVGLYAAWEDCGGKLSDVNRIYAKYRSQVDALKKKG